MICAVPQARRDASGLETPGAGPGVLRGARRRGDGMFAAPRTLTTAAVALATIAAASFVVLALALGQASTAQLLAIRAIGKIEQYHSSRAVLRINGKSVRAECTRHWGRVATSRPRR